MADDASLAEITGVAMEPTMPAILCERSGHLAHVTLNRAEHGNRISMEMFRALGEAFTALDADPAIRCILLTANGADFSLGVDVPDVLPSWASGNSPGMTLATAISNKAPLAVQAALAQAQTWADRGEA